MWLKSCFMWSESWKCVIQIILIEPNPQRCKFVRFNSTNMIFKSNLYDSSHGWRGLNHENKWTIPGHSIILIRVMEAFDSSHTSRISFLFEKCELFFRFQPCHDFNRSQLWFLIQNSINLLNAIEFKRSK